MSTLEIGILIAIAVVIISTFVYIWLVPLGRDIVWQAKYARRVLDPFLVQFIEDREPVSYKDLRGAAQDHFSKQVVKSWNPDLAIYYRVTALRMSGRIVQDEIGNYHVPHEMKCGAA
ncbi:MAG TPA: hypothetical protein VFQ60_04140 [Patescibacteria group bacterium]|nr:hypothetical protein [Patescibacteria group bacterium]